jgi:hypothetical protein
MNGKILAQIQSELKAPKGQFNKFGNYKYRSCEDIVEAAKPILAKKGIALTLTDEMVVVGSRIYVKATATLTDEKGESISTTAYAREEEAKKGMDAAQITGACSSYARKYALNGLLAIDDTADQDAMDNRDQAKKQKTPQQMKNEATAAAKKPAEKWVDIVNECNQANININDFCAYYGIASVENMTPDRFDHFNQFRNEVFSTIRGGNY